MSKYCEKIRQQGCYGVFPLEISISTVLYVHFYLPPKVYLHGFQSFSVLIPFHVVSNERTEMVQSA